MLGALSPLPRPAPFAGRKLAASVYAHVRNVDRASPLTRPASLRFAGRPLPARERGEVRKQARLLGALSPPPRLAPSRGEGLSPRAVLSERAPHPARLRYAATVDPPHRSQALAGRRVAPPALRLVSQSAPKEVPCRVFRPPPASRSEVAGRGRGWGVLQRARLVERTPHPPGFAALRRTTSPRKRAGRGEPRSNFRPATASGSVNPSGRYYRRPCARCRSIWPPS